MRALVLIKIVIGIKTGQLKACRDALRSDLSAVGAEVVVQEDFRQQALHCWRSWSATSPRAIALLPWSTMPMALSQRKRRAPPDNRGALVGRLFKGREAGEAVEELLPRLRRGHVIVTSRLSDWSGSVEPFELELLSEVAAGVKLQGRKQVNWLWSWMGSRWGWSRPADGDLDDACPWASYRAMPDGTP